MAFWSIWRGPLATAIVLGSGLACRTAHRPPPGLGIVAACGAGAAGISEGRLDSLGQRARRAGEQGDLTVLHAVSDSLDSLERLAGPRCRSDTSHAGP